MSQPRSPSTKSNPRWALPAWRIGDGAPPSGGFVALVPGADAPLLSLGLPASLKGVAREDVARRQALDRLGKTATAIDIRPARLGSGEVWSRVIVADREQVLRWRAALGAGANRCRALLPDYAALPTAPGLWTLDHDGEVVRVRLGPQDGFTAEPALAERLIAHAIQQASNANALPRAVWWSGTRDAAIEARFDGLTLVHSADDLPDMLRPRVMAHDEFGLDLARDPRADAEAVEARIRRLVWPAILLGLGAAGWSGAMVLSVQQDRAAAVAIDAQTLSAARRDLLGAAPILDLRVQVARAIEARGGDTGPAREALTGLPLLRAASEVLTQARAEVQGVALGAAVAGIALDIVVDDFRALDAVLSALSDAGLTASLTRSGINPEGGVAATLSVVGGAP